MNKERKRGGKEEGKRREIGGKEEGKSERRRVNGSEKER